MLLKRIDIYIYLKISSLNLKRQRTKNFCLVFRSLLLYQILLNFIAFFLPLNNHILISIVKPTSDLKKISINKSSMQNIAFLSIIIFSLVILIFFKKTTMSLFSSECLVNLPAVTVIGR